MRTAMAAGVLALALGGGIPAVAVVPAGAAQASAVPRMDDCDHGGLLGTVTGGVCRVVHGLENGVDGVVHGLGDAVSPSFPAPLLPSGGDSAGNDAETSADVEETPGRPETPAPVASVSEHPSRKRPPAVKGREREPSGDTQTPLPQGTDDACRAAAASPGCADSSVTTLVEEPEEAASPTAPPSPSPSSPSPSATPSASPSRREGAAPARKSPVPVPTGRPLPEMSLPDTRTPTTDVGEPVPPEPSPVVDAEAPRVELLWPAPVMQELQRQMPGERPVTPSRSSDTASTVLTTAVLISAILAVRLLYSRRKIRESIPFDPVPPGHQRVA
ncbi:hypothetical protein OG339_26390 [Streptosporangium sp. NBC_01495]|uniref:hypothetical protein n=1 Tax=Streptosporangium sp. NBC_01495 TaxID=2903899 RepID=UPI002E341DF7|nr:hypothetical protein [Streptosporangium sp. NBC_01495]